MLDTQSTLEYAVVCCHIFRVLSYYSEITSRLYCSSQLVNTDAGYVVMIAKRYLCIFKRIEQIAVA